MKNDDSGHSLTNPIHDSAGDDDEYHSDSNLVITGTLGFSSGLELETINEAIDGKREIPNMWSRDYIGLYSQYAAVGLLYGKYVNIYIYAYSLTCKTLKHHLLNCAT